MARPRTSELSLDEQIAALEAAIAKKKAAIRNKRTEIVAWLGGLVLRELKGKGQNNDALRRYLGHVFDAETSDPAHPPKLRERNRRLVAAIRREIEDAAASSSAVPAPVRQVQEAA